MDIPTIYRKRGVMIVREDLRLRRMMRKDLRDGTKTWIGCQVQSKWAECGSLIDFKELL